MAAAARKLRVSDLLLTVFVVAVAALLLVPLPTQLLDILLTLNISAALLLLLVGLYLPTALELSSFPSVLLLTTLFRLALNVASTRLILSQGDAGQVIDAFGSFLVRGDILVGLVIFTIISIVNFIVIARGASRVSEVAARFALDAMPGKQMAIDADLRAGLIQPAEAKLRRDELRRESQLYGSMDGAMKFVQGDAIAGFLIIFANIFGGLYQGVRSGLSFSQAAETYTILTVGDGLVTQVPALLVAICAGIIVTRVSAGEDSTLGRELGLELFRQPGVLVVVGVLLLSFGAVPGVPLIPFLLVGGGLAGSGALLWRRGVWRVARHDRDTREQLGGASGELRLLGGGDSESRIGVGMGREPLRLVLDRAVLYRSYKSRKSRIDQWWQELRLLGESQRGVRLPSVMVEDSAELQSGGYQVLVRGIRVLQGQVPLDAVFVRCSPAEAALCGLEVLQASTDIGMKGFWSPDSDATRRMVEAGQIQTLDPFGWIAEEVWKFLFSHPEEMWSMTDTSEFLRLFERENPGLLHQLVRPEMVHIPKITEIIHGLLRTGGRLPSARRFVEGFASYAARYADLQGHELDVVDAVEALRAFDRRSVIGSAMASQRGLKVVRLSHEVEDELRDRTLSGSGSVGDLIQWGLEPIVRPLLEEGVGPIAVLVPARIRDGIRSSCALLGLEMSLYTDDEIGPDTALEIVEVWGH